MNGNDKLRELAQAAECGEWHFDGEEVVAPNHEFSMDVLPVRVCVPANDFGPYIAAANPTAVLSLLDEIAALRAENEVMRADKARLDWLSSLEGVNLVSDDGGKWAVTGDGMQPVPEKGGFKETVDIVCTVDPEQWHDTVRAAIDAAIADEGE